MSCGLMCLTCRLYIKGDSEWACKCSTPVPSEDGITPIDEDVPPVVGEKFRDAAADLGRE